MNYKSFHKHTGLPHGAYEEWLQMSEQDQLTVLATFASPGELILIRYYKWILVTILMVVLYGLSRLQ